MDRAPEWTGCLSGPEGGASSLAGLTNHFPGSLGSQCQQTQPAKVNLPSKPVVEPLALRVAGQSVGTEAGSALEPVTPQAMMAPADMSSQATARTLAQFLQGLVGRHPCPACPKSIVPHPPTANQQDPPGALGPGAAKASMGAAPVLGAQRGIPNQRATQTPATLTVLRPHKSGSHPPHCCRNDRRDLQPSCGTGGSEGKRGKLLPSNSLPGPLPSSALPLQPRGTEIPSQGCWHTASLGPTCMWLLSCFFTSG